MNRRDIVPYTVKIALIVNAFVVLIVENTPSVDSPHKGPVTRYLPKQIRRVAGEMRRTGIHVT